MDLVKRVKQLMGIPRHATKEIPEEMWRSVLFIMLLRFSHREVSHAFALLYKTSRFFSIYIKHIQHPLLEARVKKAHDEIVDQYPLVVTAVTNKARDNLHLATLDLHCNEYKKMGVKPTAMHVLSEEAKDSWMEQQCARVAVTSSYNIHINVTTSRRLCSIQ